ncbi:MAG: hypothetical protein L0338_16130 [Acidobacteria bacterium]|nr:hypothetical protein [Acidobacteriota bacterium]
MKKFKLREAPREGMRPTIVLLSITHPSEIFSDSEIDAVYLATPVFRRSNQEFAILYPLSSILSFGE